jgi:predicted RecA/RadA family phage recombinase
MKNFISKGQTLKVVAPYNRTAGQGVLVGSIFGVACNDATSGDDMEIDLVGEYAITKTTDATTVGQRLYWDNTNKYLTTTASSNKLVGVATEIAATGDADVNCLLTAAFTI